MDQHQASGADTSIPAAAFIQVGEAKIELIRQGYGQPLLFLHPEIGLDPSASVLNLLARETELIAPSHPGFGNSELSARMWSIDDLAYFYLDLIKMLSLRDIVLVGVSFGAWIAAEVAIKSTERISCVVLADAVGIKVGDREKRDIVDIFAHTDEEVAELAYHDPAVARINTSELPDGALRVIARNRESTARFGWQPYLHDPKLKFWLHRLDVPTLFLWGESDRIVTPDYGRAYCSLVPGAKMEILPHAGHYPHLEQPELFAERVLAFARQARAD